MGTSIDPGNPGPWAAVNGQPSPSHVAIILDGNGRWAAQRGLPRLAGHRAGTQNIRRVIEALAQCGISYVTLYAFSTENWNRPITEVQGLMDLLQEVIHKETLALHRQNVRIWHIGRQDRLPPDLLRSIRWALKVTKDNTGMTLSVAFDYGGRAEIVEAVRQVLRESVPPEQLDEALFARYLSTRDLPEPDLIIRTAGEQRLSNFLLWEAAYSEYYSTPALWPDLNQQEIQKALDEYALRKRRFGALPSPV